MEQKTKGITLIVIILLITVGVVFFLLKNNAPVVQSPQDVKQVVTQPESIETPNIQEQTAPLLPNELISMEDAAKQIGTIQEKIKAGTLSAEDGQMQMDVIRKHIAPPTTDDIE